VNGLTIAAATADFCTLGGLLVFQGAAVSEPPMSMKKPMVDGEALFIGFSWSGRFGDRPSVPLLGPCKNPLLAAAWRENSGMRLQVGAALS
jgi:hypothetical protein